jgi:uncharacterized membrane protein (UPF0127 family)
MLRLHDFSLLWILAAVLVATPAHVAIYADILKWAPLSFPGGDRRCYMFQVALAETRDQYRRGLMGCRRIAQGTGLLFIYPDSHQRVFWMKNTPLELAIIFAASGGQIMAIEKGHPNSTRRIRSPDNIQYVLEINYTEAGHIRVGDQITLRLFPQ